MLRNILLECFIYILCKRGMGGLARGRGGGRQLSIRLGCIAIHIVKMLPVDIRIQKIRNKLDTNISAILYDTCMFTCVICIIYVIIYNLTKCIAHLSNI